VATAKKIAHNTGFLFAANVLQKVATLILVFYVARILGVEEFGLYSFVFSFVALFGILANLGIDHLNLRDVAQDYKKAEEVLGVSISLKIFLSIITIFAAYISIIIFGYDERTVFLVFLAAFTVVLDNISAIFRTMFVAFEKMHLELIVNSVSKAILLAGGLFALFSGYGVIGLVITAILASISNLLLSVYLCRSKIVKPKIIVSVKKSKDMLLKALPFYFIGIFMIIYAKIDIIMLSFFQGNIAVGLYDSAVRLVDSLAIIITSFSTAIFPVMSRFYAQNHKSVPLIIEKSLKFILVVILPIGVGTSILAQQIITFIYGPDFAPAAIALQLLIWYTVLNFTALFMYLQLNSMNKEKLVSVIVGVSLIVNILFNLYLIPRYSIVGAAFSTLISQAVLVVAIYYYLKKEIKSISYLRAAAKPFAASVIMAIPLLIIPAYFQVKVIFLILLAVIVYFIAFYIIKGFSAEEIQILKKALRPN